MPIALILIAYLLVGSLYVIYTPAWQAPDEPAHYNYVRQLATGHLPVMEPADYDEAYRSLTVSSKFAPQYDVGRLTYEDWQPPLYYLLQTPIFWLTGGSLVAMRFVSLLLGAVVVVLAYAVARRLYPNREWLALTTAVFVAFLPQHVAILASVNNDALAEVVIGAILLVLVEKRELEIGDWRLVGGLLGLGYLTKGTVYPLTAVVGLALLWRHWGNWRQLFRAGLAVGIPALLLGALWWGRNLAVYPGFDPLGKAAHDAAVVGQVRTAEWIAQFGLPEVGRRFAETTFNSFWGQFGWMAVPMPGWIYQLLLLLTVLAVLGLTIHLLSSPRPNQSPISNLRSLILFTTFLLTLGVHVGYNLTFVQHQGRYLFPALIPIGIGVAVGLAVWIRPFTRRYPPLAYLLPLGLGPALFGLDFYALFRIIVPALS